MFVSARPLPISSPFPLVHTSLLYFSPGESERQHRVLRDLSISLESPAGTVSLLLDTRPNDASAAGLQTWTLMTVHCWGGAASRPLDPPGELKMSSVVQLFIHIVKFLATLATSSYTLAACIYC